MKKGISILLTMLLFWLTAILVSCKEKPPIIEETTYESIYESMPLAPYDEINGAAFYNAAFGYTLKSQQGYNHWFYRSGTALDGLTDMVYDSKDQRWNGNGESAMKQHIMIADAAVWTVREFVAPAAKSNVKVFGTIRMEEASDQDIEYVVYLNDTIIHPSSSTGTLKGDDLVGLYHETTVSLLAGDRLRFAVRSKQGSGQIVSWSPSVDYIGLETDLHWSNDGEFVGDVHPFYENGKLYMFFLKLGGRYQTQLAIAHNMLTFQKQIMTLDPINPPLKETYFALCVFKDGDVYRSYFGMPDYMASSSSTDLLHWQNGIAIGDDFMPRYQIAHDYETFPKGGRDPYVFYDPDVDRYRSVGLYYRVWNPGIELDSSIGMFTSVSSKGDLWNKTAIELRRYPSRQDGEPEVPQMMKIGDRWYLLASLSGLTTHNVGGPTYYIGEKNTKIDDDDWMSKEPHRLDGEDLIASQFVSVGTKTYLFGWLPQLYNQGRWGGYLNVAREVYQLPDGTLGTRLDPYLTKMINKGAQYRLEQGGAEAIQATVEHGVATSTGTNASIVLPGNYRRNMITLTLDMPINVSKAGVRLMQGLFPYEIVLIRENGVTYLQIGSPGQSHAISARLAIGDATQTSFSLKMIIEQGIVEFYVDDRYGLAGRIPLVNQAYSIALIASGSGVVFRQVEVAKLASQENLNHR